MSDLLPCPFCGGEAKHYAFDPGDPFEPEHGVGCPGCEATMGGFDTWEQAISAWNTRPSPWRRFDPNDEGTWPEEGTAVILCIHGPQHERYDVHDHYGVDEHEWLHDCERIMAWRPFEHCPHTAWTLPVPPSDKEVKGD